MKDSEFDPLRLRRNLWELTNTGGATIRCRSCSYAKVCWVQPQGTTLEPPWSEWGRLFQWLGYAPQGVKWKVYWFPAHQKRMFPEKGNEIGPAHLNGGYCYPCDPNTIVVYRYEEATRVLIHELLHASCTDPPNAPLPLKEATTETWAELMLVALCSRGNQQEARRLWRLQSSWISNQNYKMKKHYHVTSPDHYGWRYTVGREYILRKLRMPLPTPQASHGHSSRLTHPALCF
jgi:hypothetical protein